jgi:hypothetical protein
MNNGQNTNASTMDVVRYEMTAYEMNPPRKYTVLAI